MSGTVSINDAPNTIIVLDENPNKIVIQQSDQERLIIKDVGTQGIPGVGVPAGGLTGEVLTKASDSDYDTIWAPGSGGQDYTGASPTTITVGGLPAGSAIAGETLSDILQSILVPYIAPAFSSFSIGQSSPIEVGTTISGSKNFSFGVTQLANIEPDSLFILDVTGSATIASGLPVASPQSANIGTILRNAPATYQWQGTVVDTEGNTIFSGLASVSWFFRLFFGTSTNPTLTEAQIEALSNSSLTSSKNATYSFPGGGYKYWAWPDSFGSPTTLTGFKDTSTNLAVSMASSVDDSAYSNIQNGWSYAIVSVTNGNGVTANYRVYRTKFVLGGAVNVAVS